MKKIKKSSWWCLTEQSGRPSQLDIIHSAEIFCNISLPLGVVFPRDFWSWAPASTYFPSWRNLASLGFWGPEGFSSMSRFFSRADFHLTYHNIKTGARSRQTSISTFRHLDAAIIQYVTQNTHEHHAHAYISSLGGLVGIFSLTNVSRWHVFRFFLFRAKKPPRGKVGVDWRKSRPIIPQPQISHIW